MTRRTGAAALLGVLTVAAAFVVGATLRADIAVPGSLRDFHEARENLPVLGAVRVRSADPDAGHRLATRGGRAFERVLRPEQARRAFAAGRLLFAPPATIRRFHDEVKAGRIPGPLPPVPDVAPYFRDRLGAYSCDVLPRGAGALPRIRELVPDARLSGWPVVEEQVRRNARRLPRALLIGLAAAVAWSLLRHGRFAGLCGLFAGIVPLAVLGWYGGSSGAASHYGAEGGGGGDLDARVLAAALALVTAAAATLHRSRRPSAPHASGSGGLEDPPDGLTLASGPAGDGGGRDRASEGVFARLLCAPQPPLSLPAGLIAIACACLVAAVVPEPPASARGEPGSMLGVFASGPGRLALVLLVGGVVGGLVAVLPGTARGDLALARPPFGTRGSHAFAPVGSGWLRRAWPGCVAWLVLAVAAVWLPVSARVPSALKHEPAVAFVPPGTGAAAGAELKAKGLDVVAATLTLPRPPDVQTAWHLRTLRQRAAAAARAATNAADRERYREIEEAAAREEVDIPFVLRQRMTTRDGRDVVWLHVDPDDRPAASFEFVNASLAIVRARRAAGRRARFAGLLALLCIVVLAPMFVSTARTAEGTDAVDAAAWQASGPAPNGTYGGSLAVVRVLGGFVAGALVLLAVAATVSRAGDAGPDSWLPLLVLAAAFPSTGFLLALAAAALAAPASLAWPALACAAAALAARLFDFGLGLARRPRDRAELAGPI